MEFKSWDPTEDQNPNLGDASTESTETPEASSPMKFASWEPGKEESDSPVQDNIVQKTALQAEASESGKPAAAMTFSAWNEMTPTNEMLTPTQGDTTSAAPAEVETSQPMPHFAEHASEAPPAPQSSYQPVLEQPHTPQPPVQQGNYFVPTQVGSVDPSMYYQQPFAGQSSYPDVVEEIPPVTASDGSDLDSVLGDDDDGAAFASAREVPAWAVSLAIHVGLFIALGTYMLPEVISNDILISTIVEDVTTEEFKFEEVSVEALGNDSDMNTAEASLETAAHAGIDMKQELQPPPPEEMLPPIAKPPEAEFPEPHESELLEEVDRKGSTEHPGGIPGAMDRIALEIAASLREQKTLVAWVFDQSPSVNKRREDIASRFENVYKQLGLAEVTEERELRTAVVGFGSGLHWLTPDPVSDVNQLFDPVRNMPPDNTGEENVFTAVMAVANKFMHYRTGYNKRNVMIVVVTDEAGSDQHLLEKVVNITKRNGIRVYVIGNAAPFGRKEVEIPWEIDGERIIAVLEPGPETLFQEQLKLPYWKNKSDDFRQMSSGYGPYALTRLTAETGGLYLIAKDTRGHSFDADVMRNYQPIYASEQTYRKKLAENNAMVALLQAAKLSRVEDIPNPRTNFRADTDNILREQITEAQKPFALADYHMRKLLAQLKAGEKDAPKMSSARWRANYDLAMGRLLALQARAFGYNVVLAQMKSTPKTFEDKDNNHWRLVPSPEVDSGAAVKKIARKATEYLTRVMNEHAGTPWALMAERELSVPMGWEWREYRVNLAQAGQRQNNTPARDRPRLLLAPELNNNPPQSTRRPKPKPPKKVKI